MQILEKNERGLPTVIIDDTQINTGVKFWLEWKPKTAERQHDCHVYKMQYSDNRTTEWQRREGWR